ncbi:MAG: hypothetical protein ACOH2V_13250 [Candidatus Saccharimonadaceae bacterium]
MSLIFASLSVSPGWGVDKDKASAIKARLQKKRQQQLSEAPSCSDEIEKLQQPVIESGPLTSEEIQALVRTKTPEQVRELIKSNERLLEAKLRFLCMVTSSEPIASTPIKFKDEINNLIGLQKLIENSIIDNCQNETIKKLEFSQLPIIKNNLFKSLTSGLKYIEKFHEHPANKEKFNDDRYEGFTPEQVAVCNILPFLRHDSEKYNEMVARIFSPNKQAELSAEDRSSMIKNYGEKKPGTLLTLTLSAIEGADFNEPLCLMKHYAMLLQYGMSELYESNQTKDKLTIKRRRLFFSFSNGEVETCLKFSQLLLPYVKCTQEILQIPGYEEIFAYENLIIQELKARKLEVQSPPPYSKEIINALRAKYGKQEAPEKETQVEKPVTKKKLLPVKEDATVTTTPAEEQCSQILAPQNLKKEYLLPADQDVREERKKAAKNMKRKNLHPIEKPLVIAEKTEQLKNQLPVIKIGGGPLRIYQKIIDGAFKGSMEKIVVLIEALGGGVDAGRSGSRIKFELPHILHNKSVVYLDMLPPAYESEQDPIEEQNTPMPVIHDGAHAPHKNHSKKLRSYHIEDIKDLLDRAGYEKGTVQR